MGGVWHGEFGKTSMSGDIRTNAEILSGQLEDILVSVPLEVLSRLKINEFWMVYHWVNDEVKEAVPKQINMPDAPKCIRGWLRPAQLAGDWQAFTTWRPAVKAKEQKGLFGD